MVITGEGQFTELITTCPECYRLCINLNGAWYTLEVWRDARAHSVSCWSPNAVPAGELFSVVADYMGSGSLVWRSLSGWTRKFMRDMG